MTRSEAITALYALFNAPHNADINLVGLNVLLDELYKSHPQEEPHMKSEQIKHSLSVGIKSIQSRVFDRETDEVISFVKIPIKDSGLVRCEWIELTDEEIHRLADKHLQTKNHDGALIVLGLEDFAKALMEKMRNE